MKKENKKTLLYSFIIVLIGFLSISLINTFVCLINNTDSFNVIEKIFIYDAHWYKSIIDNGYMKYSLGDPNCLIEIESSQIGMANWAFFPLLPYIIKFLSIITFNLIGVEYLGFIFSFVCNVFFIYNVIEYLKEKNMRINYVLIFLIFIFNVFSPFLYTLYTEPVVMLLIILLIRNCDKKRFLLSGFICALLSFSKVQGCFWCIYLFVKIFQECYIKEGNIFKSILKTFLNIIKNPIYFFSIVISPLGLFAFLVILKLYGLSPLAFTHIQAAWGKENSFFIFKIFEETFINGKVEGVVAILFVIFILYLIIRKKYLLSTILSLYLISACSSSVTSITRYAFGTVILLIEIYSILVEDFNNIFTFKYKKSLSIARISIFMIAKVISLGFLIGYFNESIVIFY